MVDVNRRYHSLTFATPVDGVMAAAEVVSLVHSTTVGHTGTDGLFPKERTALKVISEQFWGRAARASNDSKESGRLLIFAGRFPKREAGDISFSLSGELVGRNREIHRDPRFCLHRLTCLVVGFEVPLLHRLSGGGGEDGGSADHVQVLYVSCLVNQCL